MFDDDVRPRLEARTGERRLRRRVMKITGRAESQVEEVAEPVYTPLAAPADPDRDDDSRDAGTDRAALVRARGATCRRSIGRSRTAVGRLGDALGPIVFSVDGRHARSRRRRPASRARLAHRRRRVVHGRAGARPADGRAGQLGVGRRWRRRVRQRRQDARSSACRTRLLAAHGAVSEPVARAMADGVRARFGADIGVAVTGIAGPTADPRPSRSARSSSPCPVRRPPCGRSSFPAIARWSGAARGRRSARHGAPRRSSDREALSRGFAGCAARAAH